MLYHTAAAAVLLIRVYRVRRSRRASHGRQRRETRVQPEKKENAGSLRSPSLCRCALMLYDVRFYGRKLPSGRRCWLMKKRKGKERRGNEEVLVWGARMETRRGREISGFWRSRLATTKRTKIQNKGKRVQPRKEEERLVGGVGE